MTGTDDAPGRLERLKDVDRRTFLAGVGAGMSALAGCGSGGSPETVVKTTVKEQTVVKTVEKTPTPTATPRPKGGESKALKFNAMGYTGADDLIDQQAQMMDPEPRKPIVKEILARIWNDAPTNVMFYSNMLQPVNTRYEGWVKDIGGVINPDSYLNIRKADGGSGGRPVIGMDTPPSNLNILATSSGYSFQVLDQIYGFGTTINPETQSFEPWAFEDWELNPENVGSSSPTIVGHLRPDMTFNDGEDVTAEDVKFTVEYVKDQEPSGSISASQFAPVESVEVDSPDGTTVNYYFSEKDNKWFTLILGNVILPKHIWSSVSDYSKYTPRNSNEGVVGSGPMELDDFNWENWFELTMREDVWENTAEYATWLDEDGPFIDGLRIEIFGSQTALQQSVLDGDITAGWTGTGFSVDKAVQASQRDALRVFESPSDGWSHMSFNLRRVPLDDKAFRQLLVMLLDSDWVIDELKRGIAGQKGTYVTPKPFEEWRPPEPDEADAYEGISLPDLDFPGESGSFQLGSGGIQTARDFLSNHEDATYDYSWKEAGVGGSAAPDGKVLHVDGDPLTRAHTDNYGEPGQGPLEVSFNPPQEDIDEARIMQQWIGVLKRVGIPATSKIQSSNSQLPKIYGNENFDIFAMAWGGITVNNDHFGQLYGADGVDTGY